MSDSKSKDFVPKEIKKYGGRKSRKSKQNIKTERRLIKSRDRYTIKKNKRQKTIKGGKYAHKSNGNLTVKPMPISDLERARLEEQQRLAMLEEQQRLAMLEEQKRLAMLEEQQRQRPIRLDEPITRVDLDRIRAQQQDIDNFFGRL